MKPISNEDGRIRVTSPQINMCSSRSNNEVNLVCSHIKRHRVLFMILRKKRVYAGLTLLLELPPQICDRPN